MARNWFSSKLFLIQKFGLGQNNGNLKKQDFITCKLRQPSRMQSSSTALSLQEEHVRHEMIMRWLLAEVWQVDSLLVSYALQSTVACPWAGCTTAAALLSSHPRSQTVLYGLRCDASCVTLGRHWKTPNSDTAVPTVA